MVKTIQTERYCPNCTDTDADEPEGPTLLKEPVHGGDTFCPECHWCSDYSRRTVPKQHRMSFAERLRDLREFLHSERGERKKVVGGFHAAYFEDGEIQL